MNVERVLAYKRVIRSWQRAGMRNREIADTIGALAGSQADPHELDIALGTAAACDPPMTRETNKALGLAPQGL